MSAFWSKENIYLEDQWGGLSAILLFGDDYQLLPIINDGVVQGYSKYNNIVQATDLADRSDNLQKPTRRTSIETHQQSPVQGM